MNIHIENIIQIVAFSMLKKLSLRRRKGWRDWE